MSQQLIKQLQKKFRELEVLFKTVTPSDISVLNDLSTYLDQVKEQLKPLERAELNSPQQVIHIWSDGACSGNREVGVPLSRSVIILKNCPVIPPKPLTISWK